jgi:uncharacterized membrane protein YagU involved in acid resistance
MSTATHPMALSAATHRATYGAVGGLAGGVIFGLLMQTMDMIPMVAQLVGNTSSAVGWLVHLAISSFLGISFAVLLGPAASTLVRAAALGVGYGVFWWVLGALLLMPARLGMPVFELSTTAWQSLMGHMMFGLALGLIYRQLSRRDHA